MCPLLGAARTGCLEKERKQEGDSQQGRQGQRSHQQRSSSDVPKHKRSGQDEDLDSRVHGQTASWPGMAAQAQAGTKCETLSYEKATVAEVSQSQTPLLFKLHLSPANLPGGEDYVQGSDIALSSLLAAILHSMLVPCSSARQQSCVYGCVESSIQVLWPG